MTAARLALAPLLVLWASALGEGPRGIDRLHWLSGCWEFAAGQRTVEEQWMAPRGDAMLGMSRTVRAGRLVAWETVLLREDSAGAITYNAFPSGQPPAVFPAVEISDSEAVFANPAHDFPQRIIYRRRGDTLAARVEGTAGGVPRGSDFPYLRVPCPGRGVAGVTDGQGFTD
ncbi:MAG: DUF6265 family protein [Gemmatimonadota bacterium]